MQLASFLNKLFKKDGFILIDADSKSYIIGTPKSDNPIKLKILDKKLHYKLLLQPNLHFGEAYTNGDLIIENGSLTDFLDLALMNIGRGEINFYTKIVDAIPESKIILYNFEKLCGYKFSIECVKELVKRFPNQIIGVKDSSYNLFEDLKLNNFSVMPGSESKLFKGLQLGCSGIITATCNVTAELSRKVYDDFQNKNEQTVNKKLCDVRNVFEKFNLVSALHTYYSKKKKYYKNVLPPLSILNSKDTIELMDNLEKLNFSINSSMAA